MAAFLANSSKSKVPLITMRKRFHLSCRHGFRFYDNKRVAQTAHRLHRFCDDTVGNI